MVIDQNATIVARHHYLPFGEEILNGQAGRSTSFGFGNCATVTQMFTGQERDGGTATLDYFNARHFSAVLGSLTQPDPMNAGGDIMNPQSWNAYAYVLGNPLGHTDPSGMSIVPCQEPDSIACVGNDPEPPSEPGNPGCVAYGSEGCIVSPGGAPPVTPGEPGPGGSAGGGGGAPTTKGPPKNGTPLSPQIQACDSAILNALNTKFKTSFTDTNVIRRFQFSTGAPAGQGTLNLNISVPAAMQPTKVAVGRYPVHPATYVLGAGATLHIPRGPGGADSPLTLPFDASRFTTHLDSALSYNPIGLLTHLLQDMSSLGGYKPCP